MLTNEILLGKKYAYRANTKSRDEPLKVIAIEKAPRGRVKVEFETGPHPGLDEWTKSINLICRWGDRKELLRDEKRFAQLQEYVARAGVDPVVLRAAEIALSASGEGWAYADRITEMPEEALQRVLDRAAITTPPVELSPYAYRTRAGAIVLPGDAVIPIAHAFAAAEPETVLMLVADEQEEARLAGMEPGKRWQHDMLRKDLPAYALVRQWCGIEQEAEQLRAEISRLRAVVGRAASELRAAGKTLEANRVERALRGG